jgi:hypothetical protein
MGATHDLILRNAQASSNVPGLDVIHGLPYGSLVRLCAVDANGRGERFWVRITDKDGEVWTGEVAESLVFTKVALRDRVRFSPLNVYAYEYPDHPNPS